MYGWTFADIANMTEYQQYVALEQDDNTENTITFQDERQYEQWLKNNAKQ